MMGCGDRLSLPASSLSGCWRESPMFLVATSFRCRKRPSGPQQRQTALEALGGRPGGEDTGSASQMLRASPHGWGPTAAYVSGEGHRVVLPARKVNAPPTGGSAVGRASECERQAGAVLVTQRSWAVGRREVRSGWGPESAAIGWITHRTHRIPLPGMSFRHALKPSSGRLESIRFDGDGHVFLASEAPNPHDLSPAADAQRAARIYMFQKKAESN